MMNYLLCLVTNVKRISNKTLITVLLILPAAAYSQSKSFKFGDISVEELNMKTCSIDSLASAAILFDKGGITIEPQSSTPTTYRRHIRIKIFNKAAFDEWGNIEIYASRGELSKLKGATYNLENGKVKESEINEGSIFKTRYNKDTDVVKIAFPNLKEGSIIECSYTLNIDGYSFPEWYFQYAIPVLFSEYSLTSPSLEIIHHLRGSLQLSAHEVKHNDTYRYWQMINVPAFKPEPLMPDPSVYKSHIEFSWKGDSWLKIYESLKVHDRLIGVIYLQPELKDTVQQIIAGITDQREIIKRLSGYVKEKVQWDNYYYIYGDPPKDILTRKMGNVADINLLLGCFLNKAGLKVNPVLLSTRGHGYVLEDKPSLRQFNYVVCHVTLEDSSALLLDATEKYLPYNLLPNKCFNHKGFFINPDRFTGQYGWIPIEPVQSHKITITAELNLTDNGSLNGNLNIVKDGYAAFEARKDYAKVGEEVYIKDNPDLKIWSAELKGIKNMKDIEMPVIEDYHISTDEYSEVTNNLIYINPYIFLREKSNPLTEDARIYPIDFENIIDKTMICSIKIPDGYMLEELPKNKILQLPNNAGKCTFNISQSGNQVMVMSRLKINKTLFNPDEYFNLKEFYTRLVAKKSEVLVVKKIKN
jgi:hypothetical protein